jgi:hypothetical protein
MPTTLHSFADAVTSRNLPVGVILPVAAATIPASFKALTRRNPDPYARTSWGEVAMTDCAYGCKLYARRQGAVTRYGVLHSLAYGHSHSPHAR